MSFGGFPDFFPPLPPAPPETVDFTYSEWARFIATGDIDATVPTDNQLAPYLSLVLDDVRERYPCVLNSMLSDQDTQYLRKGVGFLLAGKFGGSPGGSAILADVASVDLDPVSLKYGGSASSAMDASAPDSWQNTGWGILRRITCVKEGTPPASSLGGAFFGLSGYRRAQRGRCGY